MKIEKIKPIPKYIMKAIMKKDKQDFPSQDGRNRFYAYMTKNDKELVKVTVAVKCYKKGWYGKQVAVHGVHSDKCFIKDIMYSFIGGYSVGWYAEGIQKDMKWYEDNEWGWHYDKYFNIYAPIVNKDYIISHFPEYKYSAVNITTSCEVIKYLRLYEQYPQVEYITKLGLHELAFSKQILKLAGKDKGFRKYLAKNRVLLSFTPSYISAIISAYKNNISIYEANAYENAKIDLRRNHKDSVLFEVFKDEKTKFLKYIGKQQTSIACYQDYFEACQELGLDMTIPKNRYPHDFKHWHDIRTDEYRTKKAVLDEQKRKEFYAQFQCVADKYLSLEYDKKSAFIVIIARKPSDLIREGDILHHCVGRMGYDQKMLREESLIFFIRTKEQPDQPLVTVEYSPTQKRVLQCYGDKDSKPDENILTFVNKKWLPYANRQIKQIAA